MKISLQKNFFKEKDFMLAEHGKMSVSTFKYSTGIEAVKIENTKGHIIVLPYKGQQIWRAEFLNHPLVMKTMFEEPQQTDDFLKTYGAFLLHCGLTAIGNPSKEDTHLLHGELPNAAYDKAYLNIGENEKGKYVEICGEFEYRIGFDVGYRFTPHCRLYEDATVVEINNELLNLRQTPQEYLYLCHINFKPVNGSRLIYSAKKENVHIHRLVPDNMPQAEAEKLSDYFDKLEKDVTIHNIIDSSTQYYQPEIVFTVQYDKDAQGRGHCLQLLPDGYACYVSHYPDQLPYGIRWISRTETEDALGMLLPATGEHKGYKDCVKKGYIKYLPPNGTVKINFVAGLLEPSQAAEVIKVIEKI